MLELLTSNHILPVALQEAHCGFGVYTTTELLASIPQVRCTDYASSVSADPLRSHFLWQAILASARALLFEPLSAIPLYDPASIDAEKIEAFRSNLCVYRKTGASTYVSNGYHFQSFEVIPSLVRRTVVSMSYLQLAVGPWEWAQQHYLYEDHFRTYTQPDLPELFNSIPTALQLVITDWLTHQCLYPMPQWPYEWMKQEHPSLLESHQRYLADYLLAYFRCTLPRDQLSLHKDILQGSTLFRYHIDHYIPTLSCELHCFIAFKYPQGLPLALKELSDAARNTLNRLGNAHRWWPAHSQPK